MPRAIISLSLVFGLVTIFSLAGCSKSGSSVDPELVAKYRTQLTLADEPDGVHAIPDIRAVLLGEAAELDHHHDEGDDHEHEHAEHEEHEADGHDHDDEADDDDHDEEAHDEAEHDEHAHDEHEEHEDEHAHDEHEGHDHDAHDGHDGHDHEGHTQVVTKTTDAIDVVLVGQIGGLANPWQETQPDFPFAKNQAAFFLSDPQAVVENEEAGHSHAPGEECAFCAAHAADRTALMAMVRFVDEKGDVLRMDVRELFDLNAKDTVVIRGSARVVAGGMMVVDATGLYVRR